MSNLSSKLLVLHEALLEAGLAHAFGGAIALAYCVEEPRGTRDLDVNVFLKASAAEQALEELPDGFEVTETKRDEISRDGYTRLWWVGTPVDIFFSTNSFHDTLPGEVVWVPFEGRDIPVLGGVLLAILKALADRPKDWADIEAMKDCYRPQIQVAAAALARLIGGGAPACERIESVLSRPKTPEPRGLKHILREKTAR